MKVEVSNCRKEVVISEGDKSVLKEMALYLKADQPGVMEFVVNCMRNLVEVTGWCKENSEYRLTQEDKICLKRINMLCGNDPDGDIVTIRVWRDNNDN